MASWPLQIFFKVIELQSFSQAAHAVHLRQPTVSSHIKSLEKHFGMGAFNDKSAVDFGRTNPCR